MRRYKTNNPLETRAVAKDIAKELLTRKFTGRALVLGLVGELGSGKTTFIKSLVKSIGVEERITSPTFLIIRRFGIANKPFKNIFHMDAYRIGESKDLRGIGLEKILNNQTNIVLVEWADRVKGVLPRETIWVKFKHGKEQNEREIIIN